MWKASIMLSLSGHFLSRDTQEHRLAVKSSGATLVQLICLLHDSHCHLGSSSPQPQFFLYFIFLVVLHCHWLAYAVYVYYQFDSIFMCNLWFGIYMFLSRQVLLMVCWQFLLLSCNCIIIIVGLFTFRSSFENFTSDSWKLSMIELPRFCLLICLW